MTTTPKPYPLSEVPPTGDGKTSRFALGSTPAGWSSEPADTVALALNTLGAARRKEATPLQPERVSVALKRVAITADGEYVLVPRGAISAVPTRQPIRSGRFVKLTVSGGALLDECFLGGDAYEKARDEDVWASLRELAEQLQASGRSLRNLNDEVAALIALRAGIEVDPAGIPG